MYSETEKNQMNNHAEAIEVIEQKRSWCVIEDDALSVVAKLPNQSIHAIISDPPYASVEGGTSALVKRKHGAGSITVNDTQFFQVWLDQHFEQWIRVIKPGGAIWLTSDLKGIMCIERSAIRVGMKPPVVGVWDRDRVGMGWLLRKTFEFFAVIPTADFERKTASEIDVWKHAWGPSDRKSGHPAEKPVALMSRALNLLTNKNDIVLDPFMGSGSTGVACAMLNRRFIGCDRDEQWVEHSASRIQASLAPSQRSLFDKDNA